MELDGRDLRPSPIEERKKPTRHTIALGAALASGITLNKHYEGNGATIYRHDTFAAKRQALMRATDSGDH